MLKPFTVLGLTWELLRLRSPLKSGISTVPDSTVVGISVSAHRCDRDWLSLAEDVWWTVRLILAGWEKPMGRHAVLGAR
jgi:hypothetical protein